MARCTGLFLIIISALYISPTLSRAQYNYPRWDFHMPLDIDLVVSGSFGELRGSHFHSGVDFTTHGKTGLPIYSIDDGYVFRIAVSPVGFGKAIYVNHPNGFSSVYAHAEWFSKSIEEIVTNIQYEKESFAIDESFAPGEIPVKRGQIIAYSGNSGSSGGPHLHFEIRETDTQKPINVHFFDFPVKDDVPPHIEAVVIYPLNEQSRVNGKSEPLYLPVVFHSGRFHLRGNPRVEASGQIGVGIETLDYFTGSWRKCSVYSIQLIVDEQPWFKSRLDGFLFSQTRYLNSHIDFKRRRTHRQVIQKSFLDENNQLDIYQTGASRGVVAMTSGESRQFHYRVKDAAGNLSQLIFNIHGTNPPRIPEVSAAPKMETLHPASAWSDSFGDFGVSFPANSFYSRVKADFNVIPNPGVGIGQHFSVLNENVPIHQFFEITIPIPHQYLNHQRLTAARVGNNGSLIYAGGTRRGNQMVVRTRDAGTYCLTTDETPPTLRLLNIPAGRNYSNRDAIRVDIRDNFSGIASYRATINGEWALFEYDPKNNLLIGFFDKFRINKGQRHTLEIVATDNVGNETRLSTDFIY
ncbi:M23 family metallopeptidase [Alkalitalea saponilacus]|uniref:Peptidase family M23 n=1 Tax=Alkalitalea saponilacus TaxID=889453 RepID=A0A1T5HSK0_9BACT|nr:M23 family metallopeptidase [Alkalitalea saponilacus]ASB47742.1 peptidase M23 [Alkalitalea saponilacus]SKC23673.1 Peptidase family M23 [Alkalitalea saponilacus]